MDCVAIRHGAPFQDALLPIRTKKRGSGGHPSRVALVRLVTVCPQQTALNNE